MTYCFKSQWKIYNGSNRPFPYSTSIRTKYSTRARLGLTFSYIYCIFVHPDHDLELLFVKMRERSICVIVRGVVINQHVRRTIQNQFMGCCVTELELQFTLERSAKRSTCEMQLSVSLNFLSVLTCRNSQVFQ